MDAGVVALVLLSALLHAGWNIVLKVKGDRLLVMTLIANGASLIALCLIPFAPVPPLSAWPYFATSLVLQCGYHVFLIQAYRYGDLGQVYPIARGTAPLLAVAMYGFLEVVFGRLAPRYAGHGGVDEPYQIPGVQFHLQAAPAGRDEDRGKP